ncbi:MAG: DUF167 domain-containing protein [Acidobacteriota bacterium]
MTPTKRGPGSGVRNPEADQVALPEYVEPLPGGCRLTVKVHPRARRERIAGEVGGSLKVEVTAAPERGAANEAVERLLAAALDVPRSSVRVVSGHASRAKRVEVAGLTARGAAARISESG